MSESAKKFTTLDSLVPNDNFEGLKNIIVENPNDFAPQDLFEVRLGETRLGPIWNQDLKAYVAQDANFPITCFVSQFATQEWIPILQHPFFQRRKPQLVARNDLNIEHEEFFLLHDGKKTGPHGADEIDEKLKNGKILVSDQISSDGGRNWGRVYEIEDFDRRSITPSGELPFMPEWQVFNNSFDEVEKDLTLLNSNTKAIETDAIASLAYLENLQSGKAGKTTQRSSDIEDNSAPIPKAVIASVCAIAAGLSFAAWLASRPVESLKSSSNTPDNARSIATQNKPRSAPVAPSRLGQDVKKNETPIAERVINKVNSRSSGFRKSKAFRDSVIAPVNRADNDFAYENDRPLEQDPIGSKLSKESIYPDDEYQQELLEENSGSSPNFEDDRFINSDKQAENNFAKVYEPDSSDKGAIGESQNYDQINENEYDSY